MIPVLTDTVKSGMQHYLLHSNPCQYHYKVIAKLVALNFLFLSGFHKYICTVGSISTWHIIAAHTEAVKHILMLNLLQFYSCPKYQQILDRLREDDFNKLLY